MSNKTCSYDIVVYDEPPKCLQVLKQSEWKNSLGNAQISLNTVAVMFLWSHNKPETPIFLRCIILFCYFNHIITNSHLFCYSI